MSKETHSFNVSVACQIGVMESIVLQHFIFLTRATGKAWVKRSRRELRETYPYMSDKTIRGVLDRLERKECLEGQINNDRVEDRTKSYRVTKSGYKVFAIDPLAQRANHSDKRANDNVTKGPMDIGSYSVIDSSSYAQEFEKDYRVKEAFTLSRKIPAVKYDSYLRAWDKEIAATGEEYAKHSEAVKHFLNYSATKYRIEVQETEKKARAAAPHQAPAVGMRKSVPVYDANGLVTQ